MVGAHLDFHLVEGLAVVDSHHGTDHLWHNNHVSQVSLDNSRLLKSWALLLSLAEPLQKSQMLALQSTTEATALAGWEQFNQLFTEIEKLLLGTICILAVSTLINISMC